MSLFESLSQAYQLPKSVAVVLPKGERCVFRTPTRSQLQQIVDNANAFKSECIAIPECAHYCKLDKELLARCYVICELFERCEMPDGTSFPAMEIEKWLELGSASYHIIDSIFEGLKSQITIMVLGADNDAIEAAKKKSQGTAESLNDSLLPPSTSDVTQPNATNPN